MIVSLVTYFFLAHPVYIICAEATLGEQYAVLKNPLEIVFARWQ